MSWVQETHGTKLELVRHFLERMFDSDMFSTRGQWQSVAVGAFALLLPAGLLLLDPQYMGKYARLSRLPSPEPFRTAAVADELSLLTLVFAITGLLAVLQWQALFPSRRDYLALASLPVHPRQIFTARFVSLLLFTAALVFALNALPSVIAPAVFSGRWQKNPSYLVSVAAQALSLGLACLLVPFSVVAMQGFLLNTLPRRFFARLSAYVQGALIAVLFLTALFGQSITDWRQDTIAELPRFGSWAPPVWFLGLHEFLLGDRDPFFTAMARRALLVVTAAVALAVLAYLVSYRRYRRLLIEAPVEMPVPRTRQWSLLHLLARAPRQQAVLQFMAKTLARSRFHRLALLAYIAGAVGLLLNYGLVQAAMTRFSDWREGFFLMAALSPLGTSVLVLTGLRHVFSMPADLPANWVFQLTESQGRAHWMRAVERFVVVCAVLPIYLVLSPLSVMVLGGRMGFRVTVLEILATLALFEVLFQSWQKLPFTCGYFPGKRPLLGVIIGYVAALFFFVPFVALIIGLASRNTTAFLIFLGIFAAVWLRARKLRLDGWGEGRLLYDDIPQIVPDLGLRS